MSTDGDTGYNCLYTLDFFILKKKMFLIIADMIHFLKNRRTQIIKSFITMEGQQIPVACLKDFLKNNVAISDKSSLSKFQDTFPIEIFNFQYLTFQNQLQEFHLIL